MVYFVIAIIELFLKRQFAYSCLEKTIICLIILREHIEYLYFEIFFLKGGGSNLKLTRCITYGSMYHRAYCNSGGTLNTQNHHP